MNNKGTTILYPLGSILRRMHLYENIINFFIITKLNFYTCIVVLEIVGKLNKRENISIYYLYHVMCSFYEIYLIN